MILETIDGIQINAENLIQGFDVVTNVVTSTLGKNGGMINLKRNIHSPDGSIHEINLNTKDGVTVLAQLMQHQNKYIQKAAVFLYLGAVQKQAEYVGDATTTTTLLANKFYQELLKVRDMINPNHLAKEIKEFAQLAVEELKKYKIPITSLEQLEKVATTSANNNEVIGKLVAKAVWETGVNGKVSIDSTSKADSEVKISKGYITSGANEKTFFDYITPNYLASTEGARILIIQDELKKGFIIEKILQSYFEYNFNRPNPTPYIVFCQNLDSSARTSWLSTMQQMKTQGIECPKIVFIRFDAKNPKEEREMVTDLAQLTGSYAIGKDFQKDITSTNPKRMLNETDFGFSPKVHITLKESVISFKDDANVFKIIEAINSELEDDKLPADRKEWLEKRKAMFTGAIAEIKVGGLTSSEQRSDNDLFDDAVRNCKAALEDGVVKGGGLTMNLVSERVSSKYYHLLQEPLKKLAENSGMSVDDFIASVDDNVLDSYRSNENAILTAAAFAANQITVKFVQY